MSLEIQFSPVTEPVIDHKTSLVVVVCPLFLLVTKMLKVEFWEHGDISEKKSDDQTNKMTN